MSRVVLISLLLVAAFLGIADSVYLAHAALTGSALACDVTILSGCNAVAQSPYSKLFGIPLAVYGVGFYVAALVSGALLLMFQNRKIYLATYLLGIFGFLASMYFVLIQAFLIKEFCIYCIASAVLSIILLILASALWKRFAPSKTGVIP